MMHLCWPTIAVPYSLLYKRWHLICTIHSKASVFLSFLLIWSQSNSKSEVSETLANMKELWRKAASTQSLPLKWTIIEWL